MMKTSIATLALAAIVAASAVAVAKTDRTRAIHVGPANLVTCGGMALADPDPGIRLQLLRDCNGQDAAGSGGNGN